MAEESVTELSVTINSFRSHLYTLKLHTEEFLDISTHPLLLFLTTHKLNRGRAGTIPQTRNTDTFLSFILRQDQYPGYIASVI
jgi:hypothetical protein